MGLKTSSTSISYRAACQCSDWAPRLPAPTADYQGQDGLGPGEVTID
jgi:hypothetical protein